MNDIKLSSAVQQLAAEARETLNGERPLPRTINEEGSVVGAKGSAFDWEDPHERAWRQAAKDHVCTLGSSNTQKLIYQQGK